MNLAAINHRCAHTDCYAYDKNNLEINIKTGHEVQSVILVWHDPYSFRKQEAGLWSGGRVQMTKKFTLKNHLVWNCSIAPFFKRAEYYFEVSDGCETAYVFENDIGTSDQVASNPGLYSKFKMAWMNENDIVKVPGWVKDTIWYQIMPERFCSAGNHFKRLKNREWDDTANMDYHCFYGGDIKGITSKLDYLQSLGISGIYLTPIFKSNSNHKYNIQDYYQIDPDFGSEEDMVEMIQSAHQHGIKVMLDAVFNHSGDDFPFWLDVVENGEKSEFKDWFFVNDYNLKGRQGDTSDGRYFSFDFVAPMPKLNTNNPKVQNYFIDLCKHWVKDWKIDGIRFDVGNEISHDFVRNMNRCLLAENPELYLLGEIWTDSYSWLQGDQYHSVMNYPFSTALSSFFGKETATAADFASAMDNVYSMYYRQTNEGLFNFVDTHDTNRAISCCKNIDEFYQKLAILMTMQGSPCIFYGTEIALEGADGPYVRQPMPWKLVESGERASIWQTVQKIMGVRNSTQAARGEKIEFVEEKNPRLIHFVKTGDTLYEKLHVYVNGSSESVKIEPKGKELFSYGYENCELKAGGTFMEEVKYLEVNGVSYNIEKLLGKGKGGYSYLAEKDGKKFVLKQIHHEPCSYYTFGNKIEAEKNDYKRLSEVGIRLPKLFEIDEQNERILKEFINGPTIESLVKNGGMKDQYVQQVQEMCHKLYPAGLNIDYYPTNFVVQDDLLYYIDYECNNYSDQWNFENWGIQYWKENNK